MIFVKRCGLWVSSVNTVVLIKSSLHILSSMMKTPSEIFLHVHLVNNDLKWHAKKDTTYFSLFINSV